MKAHLPFNSSYIIVWLCNIHIELELYNMILLFINLLQKIYLYIFYLFIGAEELKEMGPIKVTEGAEYKIIINFFVQREIVQGLKYVHKMKKNLVKGT